MRTLIVSLAFVLLITATGWTLDYFSVWPLASADHEAQKENDAAELPFTVSMQPEKNEPREWAMVLDRELSKAEARKMTSLKDSSAAFSYLTSLGGRPLAYTSLNGRRLTATAPHVFGTVFDTLDSSSALTTKSARNAGLLSDCIGWSAG